MKIVFLFILLLFPAVSFSAELIVRVDAAPASVDLFKMDEIDKSIPIIPDLGIYRLEIKERIEIGSLMNKLRVMKGIRYVQVDHAVELRKTPNDPEFDKQWSLTDQANGSDIEAIEAWNITTGGTDRNGQEIVLAVVDGGVELTHKSLKKNIWVNAHEIAGNGIDDDGNGYVDDINGWNAYDNNADIGGHYHGTHVAGIVGASGNDLSQVAGVNWNSAIMAVAGSSGKTSTVLSAYGYVLAQKKLWLSSAGKKGANVVATNSSFGIDYADCSSKDYPAWNDIYNEMGKAGILSVAATINNSVDVDAKGDVPTTCTSDYIIGVTNTTRDGKKYDRAGYGKKHIDLGAPGTEVLSTMSKNTTGVLTGTSMATPHVTGVVGLIYSAASDDLLQMTQKDPAIAALVVKNILLEAVTQQADLKDITLSGGRLNANDAVALASQFKYVASQKNKKQDSLKEKIAQFFKNIF